MKAVTSTYHIMVKFPTKNKVGEQKGDQVPAYECYTDMLKHKSLQETLVADALEVLDNKEEIRVKPVEKLDRVPLEKDHAD